MSSNNGPAGARPLNPARRPQRLFAKIQIAMKIVNQKLDEQTLIGTWLSDGEMAEFRRTIRTNIRADYDAHIDTWPRGTVHNYGLDAKRAIIQACNDHWEELFLFTNDAGDSYEELVESDLLLPDFYAT
ncbi:hypothetical protein BJ166DRAFT_598782 [Pestalotiopsis sp. NC0098]|nr:hypothetical protein BJ166DRAFT_598782 [Pestalotiopsis sp. NC0098]